MDHASAFRFAVWAARLALGHLAMWSTIGAFCAGIIAWSLAPLGLRPGTALAALAMAMALSASTGGALYLRYRVEAAPGRLSPALSSAVVGTAVWRAAKPLRLTRT